MTKSKYCALLLLLVATQVVGVNRLESSSVIRVATFNASLEGSNYAAEPKGDELPQLLADGLHPQVRNIAQIIQRVRPDILLINEFDYYPDSERAVKPLLKHYLSVGQQGLSPMDYPYFFSAPSNTGMDSGYDLDRDGVASGRGADAWGYGLYPGQYGMLLLSRFPIDVDKVRTFQQFKWKDMPGNLQGKIATPAGAAWYSDEIRSHMPLSSKSHWDVPVIVDGKPVHILASHPTPPGFDGPERRNKARNHDEVRFWVDYLDAEKGGYIYDDRGNKGAFDGRAFFVLGDLNASADEGNSSKAAISALLTHPAVNAEFTPVSEGGRLHSPDNPFAATHTASWRKRADYVLPSKAGMRVANSGVFWPTNGEALYSLMRDRKSSSDHRLVWVDVVLEPTGP